MPTFRHGKNTRVFSGAYDLSTFLKDVSLPRQTDTAETTAFTTTAKTYVVGTVGATANASGMFSYNNSAPNADITNVLDAQFGVDGGAPVTFCLDNGITAGKVVHGGLALQSSYAITGSISDVVGISADWQFSGTVNRGLSLVNADSNIVHAGAGVAGTGIDHTALLPGIATQFLLGGIMVLHLVANSVNASTVWKLQSSATLGGSYVDIASFTAIDSATTGSEAVVIPRGTVIDKFIKLTSVTTGTGNAKALAYFASPSA